MQQIVVVEALPLLPLKEIDVFASDAKVGAFIAAVDLRKDVSQLADVCSCSSKARCMCVGEWGLSLLHARDACGADHWGCPFTFALAVLATLC